MRGRPTGHPGIPLGYETGRASMHRARLVVAASAVGLPASPHNRRPYVAVGQARGVIALWLAAQGLPPKDQASLATYHVDPFEYEAREPTAFDLGSAWPQTCDGEAPAVVWSDADLIAARRLVARPAAAVAEVVRAQWRRFVDPRATTNELLAALGLGSVPIPEPFDARPFPC
jgi:hypothetical protein